MHHYINILLKLIFISIFSSRVILAFFKAIASIIAAIKETIAKINWKIVGLLYKSLNLMTEPKGIILPPYILKKLVKKILKLLNKF